MLEPEDNYYLWKPAITFRTAAGSNLTQCSCAQK